MSSATGFYGIWNSRLPGEWRGSGRRYLGHEAQDWQRVTDVATCVCGGCSILEPGPSGRWQERQRLTGMPTGLEPVGFDAMTGGVGAVCGEQPKISQCCTLGCLGVDYGAITSLSEVSM